MGHTKLAISHCESVPHFHSSTVCLLVHLSFSTGRLFTLPAAFTAPPHHPPTHSSIPTFISPQTLAFSPGSSGEGGNNYYVNKYACCNHIRATDPIRELIAGGWLCGLAADGQGLCACLTGRPRKLGEHELAGSQTDVMKAVWWGAACSHVLWIMLFDQDPACLPASQSARWVVCHWIVQCVLCVCVCVCVLVCVCAIMIPGSGSLSPYISLSPITALFWFSSA